MKLKVNEIKKVEYRFTIEGTSPYLQHRFDNVSFKKWLTERGLIIENKDVNQTAEYKADFNSYIDADGGYYFPVKQLKQCLVLAGAYVKGKVGNSTRSMKNVVAAMFYIKEERIPLPKWDTIDDQSAVNGIVKARVIPYRPQWTNWGFTFNLTVWNTTMTDETIVQIVQYAGQYCGLGAYRPNHSGPYGTFKITSAERLTRRPRSKREKVIK